MTREMVQARTRELAWIAGRAPRQVSPADHEQARRELPGESDLDRQDAMLDELPETKRWDPVPGSTGHQAPESPTEDEDDEGQNESAQLVEEGIREAGRDQMFLAALEAEKRDRREP